MKISTNFVMQVLFLVIQACNQIIDIVPAHKKAYVVVIIGFLQGMVALIGHFFNPDGSSSRTAYLPGKRDEL